MYEYRVKVTKDPAGTYLWGSAGVKDVLMANFYLIFRVDEFGEEIEVTTVEKLNGGENPHPLGVFKPGETFTVSLKSSATSIKGVKAICTKQYVDTYVHCALVHENEE
jgi:hypothetical protein